MAPKKKEGYRYRYRPSQYIKSERRVKSGNLCEIPGCLHDKGANRHWCKTCHAKITMAFGALDAYDVVDKPVGHHHSQE